MKKKLIISTVIVLLLVLIIPIPKVFEGSGKKEYNAVLYQVHKYHDENEDYKSGYYESLEIKIFQKTVYSKYNDDELNKVTQITVGEEHWINALQEIKIGDTNNTLIITEEVKWPTDIRSEKLVSVAIPYEFTVDGEKYTGTYVLNAGRLNIDDNNPKYKIEVVNLTKSGSIKVLVSER